MGATEERRKDSLTSKSLSSQNRLVQGQPGRKVGGSLHGCCCVLMNSFAGPQGLTHGPLPWEHALPCTQDPGSPPRFSINLDSYACFVRGQRPPSLSFQLLKTEIPFWWTLRPQPSAGHQTVKKGLLTKQNKKNLTEGLLHLD